MSYFVPKLPDPLLAEAYDKAASNNVLAALNDKIFFGYFSVCADGKGHGGDTTFPGLDWGQSAEALLWLGREDIVRASWEYVKSFQRADGHLPFAILPSHAGKTIKIFEFPLEVGPRGEAYTHWEPGNAFRTLAPVTYLQVADAFFRRTGDEAWLRAQADSLRRAAAWIETQVNESGFVVGGGHYMERPPRHAFEGVAQCTNVSTYAMTANLFERLGDAATAARCRSMSERIAAAFRSRFWSGAQFAEYIDPKGGLVTTHGLTDADWIAIASGAASGAQVEALWPRLRREQGFLYDGVPGGVVARPETYEAWETTSDKHDLAAMGRVWYLECWARARMRDGEGLAASLRLVAESGRGNNWSWFERYYSERTGFLGLFKMDRYVEYPACLIRIVNKFLLGAEFGLDGSLSIAPVVPDEYWQQGFGHRLDWAGRSLEFRIQDSTLTGTYVGPATRLRVRLRDATAETELPATSTAHAIILG